MMLKPITISVFVDNEDSESSALINKPLSMQQHDTEEIDFYEISAVSKYTDENDEDREYGGIISGGTYYITTLRPEELKTLISMHLLEGMVLFTKT